MRRQVCAVYAAPDRRSALAKIAALTLVIHGADDPLIHPETRNEIAEAVPGARYCAIEGQGHGILKPVWPIFIELIDEHVKKSSSVSK